MYYFKLHQFRKILFINVFVLTSLLFSSCRINKHLAPNEYLVEKNIISKNGTHIDNSKIEDFIRQKPNRKILKIIPFNLWLYNTVNQQKMLAYKEKRNAKYDRINEKRITKQNRKNEKRLAKGKAPKQARLKNKDKLTFRESILQAGEAPVILDSTITKISKNQIQKFVYSNGYFNSVVTDSIVVNKKRKRARVFFSITKSVPFRISKLTYRIEDKVIESIVLPDSINCLIKVKDIYNEEIFQKERNRISDKLLNSGFYYFAPEYVRYLVDTLEQGKMAQITLVINQYSEPYSELNDSLVYKNHPRFTIENVYVIPETIEGNKVKATDLYLKDTTLYEGLIILHNKDLILKRKDFKRNISVERGQLYQQNLAEDTYKDLSGLKIFKSVLIQYIKNPYYPDRLDCYIICQPVVKQAITLETEGTNTSGNLGIAGSLSFQNKNTFKGAELLELKFAGALTAQKNIVSNEQEANLNIIQQTFNTFQFGPQLSLYFPKPLFPFTLFYYKKNSNEKRYFTQPKTVLNTSINYQSSQLYSRTIANFSYGFRFTNSQGLFSYEVVPLEAYVVNAKLNAGYNDILKNSNDYYLLNSFQDHLTTLSKISVVYSNQSLVKKRNVMYLKTTISSSGNLLRGFYNVTNQPKDTAGRYLILNTPFSQFIKLEGDYRFYFKIRTQSKLVYRFAGGIGKSLSNLAVLPYEQSFFGGGPNGIRAWRARTLGPGSYDPTNSTARYDKIGDIQLESNLEYRFHIFKSFYGAWFVDAGNIWTFRNDPNKPNGQFEFKRFYKEIAVGSGFGIRYDFSFFVLRLDAAVKIRDPKYAENNRWTFDKQPIRSSTILNFGIGYPF